MPERTLLLDAPPADVRRAAEAVLSVRPAGEDVVLDGNVPFTSGEPVPVRIRLGPGAGGTTEVILEVADPPAIPYFGWFVRPVVRSTNRRALAHAAEALRATIAGDPAPSPPRRLPLAPPANFDGVQGTLLATVSAAAAVATFGGSLLSQHVDYVGKSFGASDRALGATLAFSRTGIIIALVATALADRRGRRRLLLISFAGVCLANAVAALAPNLAVFTVGQVLMRGFVNTALTVATVAAIEEAPEGARAYSIALLGLAGGFGYAAGVTLLPLADLGAEAWRVSFALSAVSVVFLPGFARRLAETTRYTNLAARGAERGRIGEVFDDRYGERFGVLVVATFLFGLFSASSSQFTNRYLARDRGFSGLDITVLRAVTQGVPGLAGIVIGGRLAETKGRRPVAALALFGGTLAQMAFFLIGGAPMWMLSAVAILLAGAAAPALGAFSGELFPTEIRGTANAFLLVAGVVGSATGLVISGSLSESWGLGPAIAVLGVPSLLACGLLLRLPEPAAHTLEEVSPSEV
ncbi:MAG: MFS transporter [Actinomycetota bacterium]|nr:MFS transporter [Actinomycetota bacterium]